MHAAAHVGRLIGIGTDVQQLRRTTLTQALQPHIIERGILGLLLLYELGFSSGNTCNHIGVSHKVRLHDHRGPPHIVGPCNQVKTGGIVAPPQCLKRWHAVVRPMPCFLAAKLDAVGHGEQRTDRCLEHRVAGRTVPVNHQIGQRRHVNQRRVFLGLEQHSVLLLEVDLVWHWSHTGRLCRDKIS